MPSLPNEVFTSYTVVDSAGDITVVANRVSWASMRRDAVAYAWKSFGLGYFSDFEFKFTVDITDLEAGDDSSRFVMAPLGLTTHLRVVNDMGDIVGESGLICYITENAAVDDQFRWYVWQREDGATLFEQSLVVRNVGIYYCTMGRKGTTCYLKVYSDAARTVLLDDLSFVGTATYDYRYIQVATSGGYDTDPADHATGYLESLDTQRGYEDLKATFHVGQDSLDLKATFDVGQGSENLFGRLEVRNADTADLFNKLIVRNVGTQDLFAKFLPIRSASEELFADLIVKNADAEDLHCFFHVGQDSKQIFSKMVIRHSNTFEIFTKGIIRHTGTYDMPAQFEVGQGWENLRNLVLINGIGYIVRGEHAF